MTKKSAFTPAAVVSLSNVVYATLAEYGKPNLNRAAISVDPDKSLKYFGVTRVSIPQVLEKINNGCVATLYSPKDICHWEKTVSWGSNIMENITPALILADVEERYDKWLRNPGGA